MPIELLPAQVKRCYACIQWEGSRTYNSAAQKIRTDHTKEGNCLVHRIKKIGRASCDKFEPLR